MRRAGHGRTSDDPTGLVRHPRQRRQDHPGRWPRADRPPTSAPWSSSWRRPGAAALGLLCRPEPRSSTAIPAEGIGVGPWEQILRRCTPGHKDNFSTMLVPAQRQAQISGARTSVQLARATQQMDCRMAHHPISYRATQSTRRKHTHERFIRTATGD
jgi:hypothetical protein